jgi:hypothetical protein
MKKLMYKSAIAIAIAFATTGVAIAQDYKPVLEKTFLAFDTSSNPEIKVEQNNKLSLIAKKWNAEWVPHYYAAFSKTIMSYIEKDAAKRDAYLDEADKEREDAVSYLGKESDETFVLAAMIANARLSVEPQTRWMKYGKVFSENLEKAKALNPDNPRMYYLQGISKLYTPKAFGGGKKNAQPYFEKAQGLFAKQTTGDVTKPYWGKEKNEKYLAECMKEE